MKKCFFVFLMCMCFFRIESSENEIEYEFKGRHFIASYLGCNSDALKNIENLKNAFLHAVEQSGATLLDYADYVFLPDGLTMVALLSESHASIHTYPEHNACFIDLFTCGTKCKAEEFDAALRDYLQPTSVADKILVRSELISDCE